MAKKFITFITCHKIFAYWCRFKWNSLNNNKYILPSLKFTKSDFITFRMLVIKTDEPIRINIISPVTLCSRMPRNLGCSPGAEHSDSSFRLLTWVMERTVAATNHGRPMMEHTPSMTATINRSRWYPQPFCEKKKKEYSHRAWI